MAAAFVVVVCGPTQAATIGLRVETTSPAVRVSETFDVSFVGNVTEPLLAFAFDVAFDPTLFELQSTSIGPSFVAAPHSADGVLSGFAFSEPVSGNEVTFGSAAFIAHRPGRGLIGVNIAPEDPTRGFAEVGVSQLSVPEVDPARITVSSSGTDPAPTVPEPGVFMLLFVGSITGLRRVR